MTVMMMVLVDAAAAADGDYVDGSKDGGCWCL